MLKVDLGRLEREERLSVDEAVPPDAVPWDRDDVDLQGPLAVSLQVQRVGPDVVARGTVKGEATMPCRRCLVDVKIHIDTPVEWVFREGLSDEEAARAEVYVLPERGRELDLTEPLRQQLLLAVPQYTVCRDACKGLCPQCGTNLNETTCDCEEAEVDERWGPLRDLKSD